MAAFGLDPTLAYVIGGALAVVGLALAFWGRGIWKMIMALIGMVLGGVLGVITAIIGGLLVALGVYIVLGTGNGLLSGGVGLLVFIVGASTQTMKIRRQKRIAAAIAAPPPVYANPPPPPPQ